MDVILDYDGNEVVTNEICSICLENLNNPENIHELQECKHKFHSKCLITYLRTGNTFCPLCRVMRMNSYILTHILIMEIRLLFQQY